MHARDLVEPVDAELKAKVRATLWEETPMGATWAWERLVSRPERDVGDLEYVSRLWGYVFGMAYGIARARIPTSPTRTARPAPTWSPTTSSPTRETT